MAIDAKALTLIDYLLLTEDALTRAVMYSLIEAGAAMQHIPFKSRKLLQASGVRFEGNLPTVNWVPVNAEGVTTKGTPTPFQEQAFLLRNNIDVDHTLVEAEGSITDPRAVQVKAYLESQAYDFNDKFLNNAHDGAGDAHSIVGLKARLDDPTKYGVRAENKIAGGGVDLTTANATAATFSSFLELVSKALWSVGAPDGTGCVIYANDVMCRRWDSLAARFSGQGGFSTATDQLGRTVMKFKNAVIHDIGRKADQTSYIITSTETAAGAPTTSTHTSIYVVRYGEEQFMGWQYEPIMAKDLGKMNNGVIYRTFIEWVVGLFPNTNRCFARLHGIKLA